MKKFLAVAFAFCGFTSIIFAQDDEKRPPALGVSFVFNDFVTPGRIKASNVAGVLRDNKWAKFKEMKAGIAVHYFQGLKKHVDFAGTLSGSFLRYPMPNKNFTNDNLLLEGDASLNLKMMSERYLIQPYITLGVGASWYRKYWGAFIPIGLGLRLNLAEEVSIFTTGQYRVPVTNETTVHHFFYNLGIAGAIGKKKEPKVIAPPPPPPAPADTDGDGITDDKDKCPTVRGVAKYEGCPVPDTDKDGINDDDDKCPTVAGVARYQGCPVPDTDNDGLNDEDDKCPTVPGVARYQGCPVPDADKDGVNDEEDKCPNLPGTVANQGCPEISQEITTKTAYAARNIFFETGKAVLLKKSFAPLNDVVKILNENPELKLAIDGHTDNVGADAFNQTLSEKRAASVKAYLVSKGVDESRLVATGFGETQPVADNKTATGRQKNRRVEMKPSYY
jgi:outer membrane protein OmpA-like peptidoglycan-associated protein